MNKTNLAVVAVAFVGLLAVAAAQSQAPKSSGPLTRYQLLSGEHDTLTATGTITEHVFLRIDTVTGDTAEYESGVSKDESFHAYWLPITNKP